MILRGVPGLIREESRHLLLIVQQPSECRGQEMLRRVSLRETLDVHFRHMVVLRQYFRELILREHKTFIMRVVEALCDGFAGTHCREIEHTRPRIVIVQKSRLMIVMCVGRTLGLCLSQTIFRYAVLCQSVKTIMYIDMLGFESVCKGVHPAIKYLI